MAIVDVEGESGTIPLFDIIIMNPPFTRATDRGGREGGGLFGFLVDKDIRKNVLRVQHHSHRYVVQTQLRLSEVLYIHIFYRL
jgi:hypothetical protein